MRTFRRRGDEVEWATAQCSGKDEADRRRGPREASSGESERAATREFSRNGAIEDCAEVQESVRGAGRALAVGIADAVAVEAKDGMVQGNDRAFHSCVHGVWSYR